MVREGKMNEVVLPEPRRDGRMSLEAAIAARRSVRAYEPDELSWEEIGQLLWAAQGITGDRPFKRAAPSAGGRCPLEIYVCRPDGVWHYHPEGHRLAQHMGQDIRAALAEAAWGQKFIAQAPAVFAISGVFARTTSRYGDRGRVRYLSLIHI